MPSAHLQNAFISCDLSFYIFTLATNALRSALVESVHQGVQLVQIARHAVHPARSLIRRFARIVVLDQIVPGRVRNLGKVVKARLELKVTANLLDQSLALDTWKITLEKSSTLLIKARTFVLKFCR